MKTNLKVKHLVKGNYVKVLKAVKKRVVKHPYSEDRFDRRADDLQLTINHDPTH